jgi:transcriptional regulator with XRE-family HTH domain
MMIEDKQTFLRKLGERIRNLRLENGLRQEDFDDETELGITSRGFQEIEYGRKNVKVYTLLMIAERLGVSLPELMNFGADEMKESKAGKGTRTPRRKA